MFQTGPVEIGKQSTPMQANNKKHHPDSARTPQACALPRRVGAMVYDALIVLALWMLSTFPVVIVSGREVDDGSWSFRLYLALVALGYFHLSWHRHAQTLGMRAWKIRLCPGREDWSLLRSVQRFVGAAFAMACMGWGYIEALIRKDRQTWPDRMSRSMIVDMKVAPDPGVSAANQPGSDRSEQDQRNGMDGDQRQ